MTTAPVRKRDKEGLLLDQRRLLQALASGVEPHRACKEEGITWGRFRRWLAEDEAFQKKYDALFGGTVETAKNMIDQMAVGAANVVADALESEHKITVTVTCPDDGEGCGHTFETEVDVADMNHRRWAAEYVGKGAKILRETRDVEVSGTVKHEISVERKMALMAAQRRPDLVPPHLLAEFRAQGLLPEKAEDEDVAEAEYREVEDTE